MTDARFGQGREYTQADAVAFIDQRVALPVPFCGGRGFHHAWDFGDAYTL